MMYQRFLFTLLALPFGFAMEAVCAESKSNIIYLMLDEWGYFESGHMGHPDLITPNIDRFAKEGMRFTNAMAGAPVCGPTAFRSYVDASQQRFRSDS